MNIGARGNGTIRLSDPSWGQHTATIIHPFITSEFIFEFLNAFAKRLSYHGVLQGQLPSNHDSDLPPDLFHTRGKLHHGALGARMARDSQRRELELCANDVTPIQGCLFCNLTTCPPAHTGLTCMQESPSLLFPSSRTPIGFHSFPACDFALFILRYLLSW